MSSQARTPMANPHSRLNQFNANKRISPPSPAQEPSSKVIVVISDSDTESDDNNSNNNLLTGSSRTNATTTSINRFSQNNRASWFQDIIVELSSSEESDNESSEYVNPTGTPRRRAPTPHPQHLPLADLSSTPPSSSARSSGSPPVHTHNPPQPRPRPIRKGRVHSNTNSQVISALPETGLIQEGRRQSIVTLSEVKGALSTIGFIDHLEETKEYQGSYDQQQELARKVSARLENASARSTSDRMEDVEMVKEEIPSRECIVAPATEVHQEEYEVAIKDHGPTHVREEVPKRAEVTEERREYDIRRIKEYVSNILSDQNQGESVANDDHGMETGLDGDEPMQQQAQTDVAGREIKTDDDHVTDSIESFMDTKDHFMTGSDGFYEDFDYDADYILGGEFELPSGIIPQFLLDIDYEAKMDESYLASVGQHLDHMHLALLKSYQFATTFNFSSASVVDMAIKCDGSSVKLAIANVATQDAYNRPGNLVFCDLEGGFCKHMAGHESFNETEFAFKTVTVNDVKLSYSKRFLYSGGDDGKAMIWDAETGKLLDQIADYQRSDENVPVRVNRVAVIEDSLAHEDIFATCSSEGGINIYKVNEEGKVCMRNRPLAIQGAKRIISSLAFGHGHFWDCLVAGVEGPDKDSTSNADYQQGQIVFFDANYVSNPTDLGFRQAGHKALPRSVSCLAFSASGEFVVCGTSGRTSGDEEENGDGTIRIFDVKKTKEIQSAITRHEDVNLVDFSPCGNYVISCSHTNEITVFDRRFLPPKSEYRPLHVWRHSDPENGEQHVGITSAIWWPTFRQQGLCTSSQAMLMTGGGDGCVRLWDLRAATEDAHLWSMDGRVGPIARVAASPELEHMFIGGDTGAVNVFTIDQGIVSRYEREPMHFLDESEEEN
ncbi:hypothetical protein BGZ82_003122 [Podila clonocystis]|nr:hypothetical protein BGZ82_003122 [Podila clonocystis]